MKRTRKLVLTTLMAAGGVSLTACGDSPAQNVSIDQGKATDAYAYQSLQECKDKNEVPDSACDAAEKNAKDDENAEARYADVYERVRVALGRDPAPETEPRPPVGSDPGTSTTDDSSREGRP